MRWTVRPWGESNYNELIEGHSQVGRSGMALVQQATDEHLRIKERSLYPSLHRLTSEEWLRAEWGSTENEPEGAILYDYSRGKAAAWGRRAGFDSVNHGCGQGFSLTYSSDC